MVKERSHPREKPLCSWRRKARFKKSDLHPAHFLVRILLIVQDKKEGVL